MESLKWLSLLAVLSCPYANALDAQRVANDVYAFVGHAGEVSPANGGNVGNSGFIVGDDGVIVIDTGPSYRHGLAMLQAIRRVTQKPVQWVVFTHAVQEFVFGSAAFAGIGARFTAHTRTVELMRERCGHCLDNLRSALGESAMEGTRLIIPTQSIAESQVLRIAGREIELIHHGWAATPGDLAVFDRGSGVLFAGGLVSNRRIPLLRDGEHAGWLKTLRALKALPVSRIVPGHGAVGGIELIEMTASYLGDLDREARAFYQRGATLTETVDELELPAYSSWDMYPVAHRQNSLHCYLQLEKDELER
jgi:glyoxylase-like metal-dependent hydrolase (beta-lactamase superfamily II)